MKQKAAFLKLRSSLAARRKTIRRLEKLHRAIVDAYRELSALADALAWVRYDKQTEGLPIEKRAVLMNSDKQLEAELLATLDELAASCKMATGFRRKAKRGTSGHAELLRSFVWAAARPFALAGGKVISEADGSQFSRWLEALDDGLRLRLLSYGVNEFGLLKTSPSNTARHAIREAFGTDARARARTFAGVKSFLETAAQTHSRSRQK